MVVTIGGRYGCGGKALSVKLAELLGYKLCNDEIITEAVKNSEFDMKEETFRYFDESQGHAPISEMVKVGETQRSSYIQAADTLSYDVVPLDRAMAEIQQAVLTSLADEGNCILLGRCADHFLAGRKDVVSVFVMDDEENCVARIKAAFPDLSDREIRRLIKKTNRRREDYYAFFTGRRWGDVTNYAITLNLELLGGAEKAAAYLAGAIRAMENA